LSKYNLYIGTSGWSYRDWEGVVYPAKKPRGFDPLAFMAQLVDAIEINTTFYHPIPASHAERWLRAVEWNERFLFTAKLWKRFTHDAEPLSDDAATAFKAGLAPLLHHGKLGALLVQFPWSFRDSEPSRRRIAAIREQFETYPLVIEIRHISWLRQAALDFLRGQNMSFCNIDQPQGKQSIGATAITSGALAYFRFHGRNASAWFDSKAGRDARYDYLYSERELLPWTEKIAAVVQNADRTFVMANNHYKGQAVANALQLKALLGRGSVNVPPGLLNAYPFLQKYAGGAEIRGPLWR